ncbi:MAG: methyltransferase family protein [bacterium]
MKFPSVIFLLLSYIRSEWHIISISVFIFIFIYWLLSPSQRKWIWDYLVPVLFFLTLAGRTLWKAKGVIRNWIAKPGFLIIISINNFLILSFMLLTIISYIIRKKPMERAIGIKERAFPLFVVIFHLVGSYFIAQHIRFRFNITLYISGIILSIIGATLDCLALWKLKRSFSIMVEVRSLITSGVYNKIRHPLYTGEILHFFGIALVFNNVIVYGMLAFLIILQALRAKLEEKKLKTYFPYYSTYMKSTGFFFPRFRHRKI